MMRTVCVFTGTRADYGILKPVMGAIQKRPKLKLQVVATGMHLSPHYGFTVEEVRKDFKVDACVEMLIEGGNPASTAKTIGCGIVAVTQTLEMLKPDIVLVLGDRIEALAVAVSSVYMNVPLAHVHGGDTALAGLDENCRHAITKLANIHFPATEKSRSRILCMGERERDVYLVGSPSIDSVKSKMLTAKGNIEERYKIDLSKPVIVCVQHPVTTEYKNARKQIRETLKALALLREQTIIIYPNTDIGGAEMINEIENYKKKYPFMKVYKNIPHQDYLSLLKYSSALVGNSSGGVIESSAFNLPVVNVGIRQQGRERGTNVVDVGHDKTEILSELRKILAKKERKPCQNPYGDGNSGEKIAEILSSVDLDEELLKKKLTY